MERQFVLHAHSGPGWLHWDLMLEQAGALVTWQLAASPADLPVGGSVPAKRLPDHRREYLSYEGPLSGNRGRVDRVDRGRYDVLAADEDRWTVVLEGSVLKGRYDLRRAGPAMENWTLERLSNSNQT